MKPSRNILSFGINGSLRKTEVQFPVSNQNTEYYLFNSAVNMKAYSNNGLDFAYYGYNATNTRTYKLCLSGTIQWQNGQQLQMNLQPQLTQFYPNAYINFNGNGEYTKHYYNGTERIASRLGNVPQSYAVVPNSRLAARITQVNQRFQSDIQELMCMEIPVETPQVPVENLQATGNATDIFYYHTNHLGSTAFVTDNNATITQGFLYAPFGEITTEYAPSWQNGTLPKYSFNAKELDEETGMYYYEARYYKPPVFTSRDAMMDQKPWLTPYHYCSNNPVGRVDPNGISDEEPPTTKKTYRIENSKQKSPYSQSNNNTKTSTTATPKTPQRGSTPATPQQGTLQPAPNQPSSGIFTWGFSLDVNISVGAIGYSFEVGFVQDASGNAGAYYSHGPSAGFEASIGFNGFYIPNSDFKLNVFEGQSMSINANWSFFSGGLFTDNSRGAEKDYYFNNYGGAKVGVGIGVGASVSHTKTYLIKSNPNVGGLEKFFDSVYFRTGGMR